MEKNNFKNVITNDIWNILDNDVKKVLIDEFGQIVFRLNITKLYDKMVSYGFGFAAEKMAINIRDWRRDL